MENVSTESNDTDSESVSTPEYLSGEDYINLRVNKGKPPEPKKEEEETKQEPAAEANDEQDAKESESTPSREEEVLSNINLDDLSESELKELSEKIGSRAVARYGELTARRKAAEAELAQLKAKLAETPKVPEPKVKDNPYKAVKDLEALQEKFQEVDETIEYAEDLLWKNEHLAHDDVVTEINGKDWTKEEVRNLLREAQKARKTYLPAQAKTIQEIEQRKALKQGLSAEVRKELPWLSGEDNDVRRQFEGILNGPVLKKAMELVPEFEPYAEYLAAHASNSIFNKAKEPEKVTKAKLTPPSSPSSAATKSEAPAGVERQMKELRKKLEDTGAEDAYEKLRTLQLSRKK